MSEVCAEVAAARSRRNSTGSSSRRSPVSSSTVQAREASSMVARGSAEMRPGSSPSPSWASTESVPTIPLSNVVQAKAPSLVVWAPPMAPSRSAPAERRISTVRRSASDQLTATSSPSRRTMGSARRRRGSVISNASPPSSGPLTDSKAKRPLSQSQLWFTGSESTPSRRVSRPADDWTATRHPTEQPVHVDSTCSRSHGRAAKR